MANDMTRGDMTASQKLALAVSIVFLAVGLLGFLVTGFDGFANPNTNETLLGFEVNPLHNIVHLAFGALGLMMYRTHAGAKSYGIITAVGYGLVFLYGLAVANSNEAINFLSLNSADNLLHLALAAAGVAIAALPARSSAGGRTSHA